MQKKRDERRTELPPKLPPEHSERPTTRDDAIDAAIKRSIDTFGPCGSNSVQCTHSHRGVKCLMWRTHTLLTERK